MSNPTAGGSLLSVLVAETGLRILFENTPKTNTLIALIRRDLDLSGHDAVSRFKADSYGDCIDHTRAAKHFLDSTGLAETKFMKGTCHPSVAGQDVDTDTYALLVRDVVTDSWWFWKASPNTCEPLASMPRLALPKDLVPIDQADWNFATTSTIIIQMVRHKVKICAAQLITRPSLLSTVASALQCLPLIRTASYISARFSQVFPTAPCMPTIITKSSSSVYSFSTIDKLPSPSTDVKVEWLDKKVTFILTIDTPPFKLSELDNNAMWDDNNPPTISVDRSEKQEKKTILLRIISKPNAQGVYQLVSIDGQGPAVTCPKPYIPPNSPYVENAPTEFSVLMWLCYRPMTPANLNQSVSDWWNFELQPKSSPVQP